MKKDRSFSGNIFDSPSMSRKGAKGASGMSNNDFRSAHSSTRLRDMRPLPTQDITTFHIPGLDVRVHYISKTEDELLLMDQMQSSRDPSTVIGARKLNKKATLTTWMTLQSIPEETIITPTILEFLEQALDPLPTFNPVR